MFQQLSSPIQKDDTHKLKNIYIFISFLNNLTITLQGELS